MIVNSDYAQYLKTDGADRLYIFFSARDRKKGTFDKYPVETDQAPASFIYLNCTDNAWYHDGVAGLGDLEQTLAQLQELIQDSGASQVITVGSSMGGFGALYYGLRLKVETIICFGSETVMNIYGGHSHQNLKDKSLIELANCARTDANIFYINGDLSPVDIFCAEYAMSIIGGQQYVVKHADHLGVARFLKDQNLLPQVIEACTQNDRSMLGQLLQSAGSGEATWFAHNRLSEFNANTISDFAILHHADHQAGLFGIANFMVSRKAFLAAKQIADFVEQKYGASYGIRLIQGRCALKLRRLVESEHALLAAAKLKPDDHEVNFLLSTLYHRQNKLNQCVRYCDAAIFYASTSPNFKVSKDAYVRFRDSLNVS